MSTKTGVGDLLKSLRAKHGQPLPAAAAEGLAPLPPVGTYRLAETALESSTNTSSSRAPQIPKPGMGHADLSLLLRQAAGLLVFGWVADPGDALGGQLRLPDSGVIASSWAFRYARPDVTLHLKADPAKGEHFGFAMFFPWKDDPGSEHPPDAQLRVSARNQVFELQLKFAASPAELLPLKSLWDLARTELKLRFDVLPAELLTALVGPLPPAMRLHIDRCIAIPNTGYLLSGWWVFPEDEPVDVYLVDETTLRSSRVDPGWEPTFRPDVVEALRDVQSISRSCGFVSLVRTAHWSKSSELALYFCIGEGRIGRWPLAASLHTRVRDAAERILGTFPNSHPRIEPVLKHVGPALESVLAAKTARAVRYDDFRWFGKPPADPVVSIVIPIWRQIDLLPFQLAILSLAVDAPVFEVILAVDDPSIEEAVLGRAQDWKVLYDLPFAVASAGQNLGFADQLNLAAGVARGGTLAFMHSDVLPDHGDWLGRLMQVFGQYPECGLLAPKLLFEDGSVQSEGVRFRPLASWPGLTEVEQLSRGNPDHPDPRVRSVEALSSGCLLVRREVFEQLQGLDGGFLLDDEFAIADFCARASQAGWSSMVAAGVSLRHLEGHSWNVFVSEEPLLSDPKWREKVHLYNGWRLARRLAAMGRSPA